VFGAAGMVDDQTATAAVQTAKVAAGRMGTAVVRMVRVADRTAVGLAEQVVAAEVGRKFVVGIEIVGMLGIAAPQESD
jgi:hypothetical protein